MISGQRVGGAGWQGWKGGGGGREAARLSVVSYSHQKSAVVAPRTSETSAAAAFSQGNELRADRGAELPALRAQLRSSERSSFRVASLDSS